MVYFNNMIQEVIRQVVIATLSMIGFFSFIYCGAYFVELAKQKVRRKMMVCDNCFGMIKKMKE